MSRTRKGKSKPIEPFIYTVRGNKVILDADLARLYSVEVKRLNEQLRRNRHKFPPDFAFRLTAREWEFLRSQNATSNTEEARNTSNQISVRKPAKSLRSQNATSNFNRGGRRYLPFVFTEHGALQAANILNNKRAAAMSIYVIRAFVKMRQLQSISESILKRLAEIDTTLLTHDTALREIYEKLVPLLERLNQPEKPAREIGFHVKNGLSIEKSL